MKEAKDMSGDELNRTIAELCGAKWIRLLPASSKKRSLIMLESFQRLGLSEADGTEEICQIHELPNYAGDLNAMQEAEKLLNTIQKRSVYLGILHKWRFDKHDWTLGAYWATARQRAEAFVMVFQKGIEKSKNHEPFQV